MALTKDRARELLGWARVGLGSAVWLAPKLLARLGRVDPGEQPALVYAARIAGARDVAVGVALLQADDDEEVDRWLDIGVGLDAADAFASLIAAVRGQLPRGTGLLATASSVAAVVFGLVARRR